MPRAVKIAGIVLLVYIVLLILPLGPLVEFALILVFGWIFFLLRVITQVSVNWSGVATAAVCLTLFTLGAHRFLSWFCRHLPAQSSTAMAVGNRWRLAWTCYLVSSVVIMFVAGISAVGLAHQFAWMATGKIIVSGAQVPRLIHSRSHLEYIGIALAEYHDAFRTLPIGATRNAEGRMLHGWQVMLLPFLEERRLFEAINHAQPWDDRANHTAATRRIDYYVNTWIQEDTDSSGRSFSHYAGNSHVFDRAVPLSFAEMTDGRSKTILAGEIAENLRPWIQPGNWRDPALGINRSPMGFGCTWKSKGAQFLFADGKTAFLSESIDPRVLQALATPAASDDAPETHTPHKPP